MKPASNINLADHKNDVEGLVTSIKIRTGMKIIEPVVGEYTHLYQHMHKYITHVCIYVFMLTHTLGFYTCIGKINKKTLNRNCFVVYGSDPWSKPDANGLMFCAKWVTGNTIQLDTYVSHYTYTCAYICIWT